MIDFLLGEEPQLEDLTLTDVDSYRARQNEVASGPLSGRVAAAGPRAFRITVGSVAKDEGLRQFIEAGSDQFDYYFVFLRVAFVARDGPGLESAQVQLTLTSDPGAPMPFALSIRPAAEGVPVRPAGKVTIGPKLSLPSYRDLEGDVETTADEQASVLVRGLGVGGDTPGWEFTRARGRRLEGHFRLELIVQAGRGAQLSVNGTVTAEARRGILPRYFRAHLPQPLTFKQLIVDSRIRGDPARDAGSGVGEGAKAEDTDDDYGRRQIETSEGDRGSAGGHRGAGDREDSAGDEPRPRFLTGILPERAATGARISLLVQITLARTRSGSAALKGFPVSPAGTVVTIAVSAPGLIPLGDLEQDLSVPLAADSDPVRFGFIVGPVGPQPVQVRAFAGGTFLGELTLEISVEAGGATEQGHPRTVLMAELAAEPGEVTLQVSRTATGGYSFQLLSAALYPSVTIDRLAGDPGEVVGQMVAELRALAKGTPPYATPALARRRLRSLGSRLWADVVPQAIREQFWAQRDRIKLFTIASDMDTVPWELIYPVDDHNDDGFLVEQFPVVRRVYGQGRARVLLLDRGAGFIVPPRSPANAMEEVAAVRAALPGQVLDRGTKHSLGEVLELLDAVPSVLHFAGHNAFTDESGSLISLDGGPLRPSDLSYDRQRRAFASARPLVFFNGCRTAGEVAGFTQLISWATEFMRAGAGAFIGSLWAVRSASALTFAGEFYTALVRDGEPLGIASLRARQAIMADEGDPTWLAYTVYGNPSASVTHNPYRYP